MRNLLIAAAKIMAASQGKEHTEPVWERGDCVETLSYCPLHADDKASLSMKIVQDDSGKPRLLIHCHGGCPQKNLWAKVCQLIEEAAANVAKAD